MEVCAVAVAKQCVCPSPAATPEVTEVVTSLFEPDVCSGGFQNLAAYVLEPGALRMRMLDARPAEPCLSAQPPAGCIARGAHA